jgi:6-pyruvoyltetrahydropterin/6-carboxytetrahydropterin synthase
MPTFKIEVSKDYMIFAAAHFVTYDGDKVEPLHGHNYRTTAGIEGDLDENAYVANFSLLKQAVRGICDRLDHRLLLPTGNPLLDIERETDAFIVRAVGKTYRFPADDVVQLPVRNTTSELLAEWIGAEVEEQLRLSGALRPGMQALVVEVEESFGQRAICRREIEWRS